MRKGALSALRPSKNTLVPSLVKVQHSARVISSIQNYSSFAASEKVSYSVPSIPKQQHGNTHSATFEFSRYLSTAVTPTTDMSILNEEKKVSDDGKARKSFNVLRPEVAEMIREEFEVRSV